MPLSDIPNWVTMLVAVIGAPIASYVAVQRLLVRLVTQMEIVLKQLTDLGVSNAVISLQVQKNEIKLEEHEGELARLHERLEGVAKRGHELADEITPNQIILQMVCEKLGINFPGHK